MSGKIDINVAILDDIKRLQQMEQSLYTELESAQTDFKKQGKIMDEIDQLTQMRMNMFKQIQSQFGGEKEDLDDSKKGLSTQYALAKVAEGQLADMRQQIRKMEQIKNDKMRMVEIGSYEADRYDAYKNVMLYILLTAILMVIINKISQLGIVPDFLSTSLMALILVISVVFVGRKLLDIGSRSPLNFDKYDFSNDNEVQKLQPSYETVLEHDKRAFAKMLYGAETSYDEAKTQLSGYTKSAGEEVEKLYQGGLVGMSAFSSGMPNDDVNVSKVQLPSTTYNVEPNQTSKNIENFALF